MKYPSETFAREAPDQPSHGPLAILALSGLAVVAMLVVLPRLVSSDAILPVITLTLFVLACVAAKFARNQKSRGLTYWDVAGLLTLAGIFVAAAVEPEQLQRLIESDTRTE
jgi:uncharacterized membrane protein YoaK (UPF0700 family)